MPQMPFTFLHAGTASKHGVFQGGCLYETVDRATPQPPKIEQGFIRYTTMTRHPKAFRGRIVD
jgi:hypothetical protein